MFETFWRLLSKEEVTPEVERDLAPDDVTPSDKFDIHFVSLFMLAMMIEATPTISLDDLATIVRKQFGDIDFTAWPDLDSFYAALSHEYSMGFKAMCVVGFLVLGTDTPISKIVEIIRQTFEVPGAKDLPEFIEAECLFLAANIPADSHTVDHHLSGL